MARKTEDLIEGFNELLAIAGERLQWGETAFDALLRDAAPAHEAYDLAPGYDNELTVAALRSAFPGDRPKVGDAFTDVGGRHYRVVAVINRPGDMALRFKCQLD
jgi:hypothetical protein